MADVTEVIHKISYEVNDEALLRAQKILSLQLNEIIRLSNELVKYQDQLTKTSNKQVVAFETLTKQVEKISKQLEKEVSKTAGYMSDALDGVLNGLKIPTTTKDVFKGITEDLLKIVAPSTKAARSISGVGASALTISKSSLPLFLRSIGGVATKFIGLTNIIGLAINVLSLFDLNIFGTKDKVADLGDEVSKTADAFSKISENAASDLAKMFTLKTTIEDTTLSYKKRKEAIDELRRQYPDYFKDLSDEEVLAGRVGNAYYKMAQAVIASAKAKLLSKQLEDMLKDLMITEKTIKDLAGKYEIQLEVSIDPVTGLQQYNLTDQQKSLLTSFAAANVNKVQVSDGPKNQVYYPIDKPEPTIGPASSPFDRKSTQGAAHKAPTNADLGENINKVEMQLIGYRGLLSQIQDLQLVIMDNNKRLADPKTIQPFNDNPQPQKRNTTPVTPIAPRRLQYLSSNIDATLPEIDTKPLLDATKQQTTVDDQRRKQLKETIKEYQTLASAAVEAYSKITKAQQEALDREIAIREKRVEDAKKLAERGNADALRLEEQRLEDAQKKKEEIGRREQAVNSALALSNSLVAVTSAIATATKSGDPYTVAARVAAAIAAVLGALVAGQSFVKSFDTSTGAFADGVVDYKGKGGPRDDKNLVRISNGESVITADGTQRNRALLEAINKGESFSMMGSGLPFVMPHFKSPIGASGYASATNMRKVEQKLDNVVVAIEENRMKQNIFFNEYGVGLMTERAIKKNNRRFK